MTSKVGLAVLLSNSSTWIRLTAGALLTVTAFVLTASAPHQVEAHGAVDQQQDQYIYILTCTGGCGQTFTPTQANIVAFDIVVPQGTPAITPHFILRQFPTGTSLSFTGLAPLFVGENHIEIPGGPIPITPGQKYEFRLTDPGINLEYFDPGNYAGGVATDNGVELTGSRAGYDLGFVTYYQPNAFTDQTQYTANQTLSCTAVGCGQTFVPGKNNISSFDVDFDSTQSTTTTGHFLLRQYSSASNLITFTSPTALVEGINHITIPGGPISLVPGTAYELRETDATVSLRGNDGNPYAGGAFTANGAQLPTYDLYFVTYYTPVASTVGVFRNALWYLNKQNDGSNPDFTFYYGGSSDIPLTGDWDCSGTTTPGIFRNGAWYLSNSKDGNGPNYAFFFGAAGDIPVVGDWDGNGCDSVGIFRNGVWYLTNSITGSPAVDYSFFYGATGDKPVTGDWDGDGKSGVGVFRNGLWYLTNQTSGSPSPNYSFFYGVGTDKPVVGDWDGDGSTSVGVFRGGLWYLTNSITGSPNPNIAFYYGVGTDTPVTGSWGELSSSVRTADQSTPSNGLPACAASFSCVPGPTDWSESAAPKGNMPLPGWTGRGERLPPAGWTGQGEPLPAPGWTGLSGLTPAPTPVSSVTPKGALATPSVPAPVSPKKP